MIIRYFIFGLISLIAYVVGLFVTPLNNFIKVWVRKYKILYPLWLFLNDTVKKNDNDIDYGDYGRFKHNFIGFYRQNALRNSHWNLRVLSGPKRVEKTDVEGELNLLSKKWNFKEGKTSATYRLNGIKYFRISLIKRLFKIFKRTIYFHYQFGTNDYRYLYKMKIIIKQP